MWESRVRRGMLPRTLRRAQGGRANGGRRGDGAEPLVGRCGAVGGGGRRQRPAGHGWRACPCQHSRRRLRRAGLAVNPGRREVQGPRPSPALSTCRTRPTSRSSRARRRDPDGDRRARDARLSAGRGPERSAGCGAAAGDARRGAAASPPGDRAGVGRADRAGAAAGGDGGAGGAGGRGLALVSQSGTVAAALVERAADHGIGLSCVLSLGGMADVDARRLPRPARRRPANPRRSLSTWKAFRDPRQFLSAARPAARAEAGDRAQGRPTLRRRRRGRDPHRAALRCRRGDRRGAATGRHPAGPGPLRAFLGGRDRVAIQADAAQPGGDRHQ